MALETIPHKQSEGTATGVAATNPMSFGIKAVDVLLALVKHKVGTGGVALSIPITDATVAAGTITLGTVDTTGYTVTALWTKPA